MPMKKYLCLWESTYAYEKVPMSMRKNLCLKEGTFPHEKVPMHMRKYLCIWESTYDYKKVHMPTTGFLPVQIWVRLPDPTDLPLSDLKILGKKSANLGGKNCQFGELIC